MFGHIPGITVGQTFEGRQKLHNAKVHPGLMKGIAPEGASIVISGGYADDKDYGDVVIYTGEGGRDQKSGRQIADQTFTGGNAALARNSIEGNPVRVCRLLSGKTYRYDGLYRVEEYWSEKGKHGFLIYRFRLVRLADQDPLTRQPKEFPKVPIGPIGTQSPSRSEVITSRIIRNTAVGNECKRIYKHTCQVCSTRIETPAGPYAECCHIKPLGKPHNGPDTLDNVLCLCPNCHVMFDNHAITIGDDLKIVSTGEMLQVKHPHQLSVTFIRYHRGLAKGLIKYS